MAENVLHCNGQSSGIDCGRVTFATSISYSVYGLRFRLLAYRNAFRAINAWTWPENQEQVSKLSDQAGVPALYLMTDRPEIFPMASWRRIPSVSQHIGYLRSGIRMFE